MKTLLHKADTRGQADHGWLKSFHSFSFADYHDPKRMGFGALRVLNDDLVRGGGGFGRHPHENMEIISIPLLGALEHEDSMGHKHVIRAGDIQVMSAGTGIHHAEYNSSQQEPTSFLQIWVIPKMQNVEPRYDQQTLSLEGRHNQFQQVLSPNKDDEGVWIYQDAWFHLGDFEKGQNAIYELKKQGNGVYIFVLQGKAEIENQQLDTRDGYGVWDTEVINFQFNELTKILLMEVPMS